MERLRSALVVSAAVAFVTALAAPAAAQGTMTPSLPPPPPPPPELAPTPTEPPVVQQATPAPTTEGPVDEHRRVVPPARRGFQIAVRTGAAVPLGEVDKGEKISDSFGVQVPLIADIGFKVIPQLFLGGYIGISVGGLGDELKKRCDAAAVDCTAVGFRIGIQGQLHIIPDGRWNPWVGYGIGYEVAGASGASGGSKLTAAFGGVELAHFMAGVDYRITRVVGIGPYAAFALGQYSIASVEETRNGISQKKDGDITNKALHEWLLLGVKVTFFP